MKRSYRFLLLCVLMICISKSNSNVNIDFCVFPVYLLYKARAKEIEGVQYIRSKRGTEQVLFDGNTFTPNEKNSEGSGSRTWKCSMYYKLKCRSRVTTRRVGSKEFLKPSNRPHNHDRLFPTQ